MYLETDGRTICFFEIKLKPVQRRANKKKSSLFGGHEKLI